MEIFKDILGFEGFYQVSNFGNVRSLQRIIICSNGRKRTIKEKIMFKSLTNKGYYIVMLNKNSIAKVYGIHVLVAIAFLNYEPCGHKSVINHKNFIRTDNRHCNLEVVSHRVNTNRKHLKSSSQYTGVCWHKRAKKYISQINIKGKLKHLGYFINEYDAHLAYENELEKLL